MGGRGAGVLFFVYSFGAQEFKESYAEDTQVEEERDFIDVEDVEIDFVLDGEVGPSGDLG